jgi:hypothetical protein
MINFSINPYNDDFDESKNFAKILFQPEVPIQARELTQIQSILQNQIKYQGNHIFKNGTVVSPGYSFFDNTVHCVTFNDSNFDVSDKIGYQVIGNTSNASAIILAKVANGSAIVKFTTGNKFTLSSEQVLVVNSNNVSVSNTLNVTTITPASIVSIDDGVYYINGYFVRVNAHKFVLSSTSATPTCNIGLEVKESIITCNDDATLYDNSQGFPNVRSPGADRYKLSLTLSSRDFNYTETLIDTEISFVQLMKVKDGVVQKNYQDTQYSELAKALARRTYDESGDYIVAEFPITIGEYYNNNLGQYSGLTTYKVGDIVYYPTTGLYYKKLVEAAGAPGTVSGAPWAYSNGWQSVYIAKYNGGIDSVAGNYNNLVARIGSGKAYIKGFEVAPMPNNIKIAPADTKALITKNAFQASMGTSLEVATVTNLSAGSLPYAGSLIKDLSGATIGTCVIKSFEQKDASTSLVYVERVVMNSGKDINLAKTIANGSVVVTLKNSSYALAGSLTGTSATDTLIGTGTQFLQDLKPGYYIQPAGSTDVYTVLSIQSNTALKLTSNLVATVNAATFNVITPTVKYGNSAIIKLDDYVSDIVSADTSFYMNEVVTKNSNSTGNEILLSTEIGSKIVDTSSFMVMTSSTGVIQLVTYDSINKKVTGAGIVNSTAYTVLFRSINTSSTSVKTKTLATKDLVITSAAGYDYPSTLLSNNANFTFSNTTIQLPVTDAVRLVRVYMSSQTGSYNHTDAVDITDRYSLINGQTSDYYGPASIVLNSGATPPSKPIRVVVEYYTHGAGNFFCINSYTGHSFKDIPSFGNIQLRDAIDFRGSATFGGDNYTWFTPTTQTISKDKPVLVTYNKYLPRKDVLVLGPDGVFGLVNGIPEAVPSAPITPENVLDIATITVLPYDNFGDNIRWSYVRAEHKGYTMAEIGALEKRIENVEYYVALNALQKNTVDMKIYDENGLERYKNGFAVDDFRSTTLSDIYNQEYKASLDLVSGICEVPKTAMAVALGESSGVRSGYRVTGGQATVPYSSVPYLIQDAATQVTNVNPFAAVSFNGLMQLFPAVDNWTDIVNNLSTSTVAGIVTNLNRWVWDGGNGSTTTESSTRTVTVSDTTKTVTTTIEKMRARSVVLQTSGLAPNTTMYAFMDGENISSMITPCSVLRMSGVSGTFNTYFDGIQNNNQAARVNSSVGLYDVFNRGDVIEFTRNSDNVVLATAVIIDYSSQVSSSNQIEKVARIGNLKWKVGTSFGTAVITVKAQPSGATATFVSLTTESSLKTNSMGMFVGIFNVPANRFNAGTKTIRFTDSSIDDQLVFFSRSAGDYVANGTLITNNRNVVTRTDTTNITTIHLTVPESSDPLAQSFVVTNAEGIMATSVDLFFKRKPSNENDTITCQICEMQNGYPTRNIIGSVTLPPSAVLISNNASLATTFKFTNLLRLEPNTEYCIKVLANTINYEIWIAELGKVRVDRPVVVSEQPATGSLFKSQNNSTWSAEQLQDLKFTINRADFVTNTNGLIKLENRFDGGSITTETTFVNSTFVSPLPAIKLVGNPVKTTAGTTKVIVKHHGHGRKVGHKIRFRHWKGITYHPTFIADTGFTVASVVDDDTYIINTTSTASVTEDILGNETYIEQASRYEAATFNVVPKLFNGCNASVKLKTVESGTSVNAGETIVSGNTYYFNSSRWLLASDVINSSSINAEITISTTNSYVSPVVDISAPSITLITNRINQPSATTHTLAGISDLLVPETDPANGSALAKYVTIPINLSNVSQSLRVLFAAMVPEASNVQLYYRTCVGESSKLATSNWINVDISNQVTKSNDGKFKDVEVKLDNINTAFTCYQIKLVMLGTNPATPPKIKDFRSIALA